MTYLPTSAAPKARVGKTIYGWERGVHEDFILNEYSRIYLEQQQLAACHLSKLKFSSQVISKGDLEWSKYLGELGITSLSAVKHRCLSRSPSFPIAVFLDRRLSRSPSFLIAIFF